MKIENFTPVKGRLIIKKGKELTKMVEREVPDYDNPIEENPDKLNDEDPQLPVIPMKIVKEKATKAIQIGEIASCNPHDGDSVGDKIVYGIHSLREFDLFSGKYGILSTYDVLGFMYDHTKAEVVTVNDKFKKPPVDQEWTY